jgi:hypothetical protein
VKRRRWLIGTLCLAFALVGTLVLLPPLDEYAPLDRVGKSMTAEDYQCLGLNTEECASAKYLDTRWNDPSGWTYVNGELGLWKETRVWVLKTSESETADFIRRFASASRGWQRNGTGRSSQDGGKSGYQGVSVSYRNEDTGDQLEYEVKRFWPGDKIERTIHLSRSPSSHQLWPKIKRWARLLFKP